MTKDLLAGLEAENVTIENIDKYLQQTGVIVRVHVGRIRGNFELTPATLGVNTKSDEVKDFFKNHVKNGSMSFIPLSVERELQKIENRIRMSKVRMSIGYDNSYMPIDIYKQFAEKVKEAREEYLAIRDNILSQWEQLKDQFTVNLKRAISKINPKDQEAIFKAIMNKYPSKVVYQNSFYLRTSLKAFPVMANLSLLDENLSEEVKETAIRENLQFVHEAVGVALNDIFQVANTCYKSLGGKRKLENRTKGSVSEAVKNIRKKNILKHPTVEQLVDDLEILYRTTNAEDALELAESILAKSYGEAVILNLLNYLDLRESELEQSDLEILSQAYAHVA